MTITIAPFTFNLNSNPIARRGGDREREGHAVTYWGIYLDDKRISYTSGKELAEKTVIWIEKWLEDRI